MSSQQRPSAPAAAPSERHSQPARAVGQPEPGYFAIRLVRRGPRVPARICFDGVTWHAEVNGERFAGATDPAAAPRVFSIWHGGDFITEREYRHMLDMAAWARRHAPDHPAAKPNRPIDLTNAKSIF
jgi:hypothetical protein